jgi:hypothetical protein
VAGVAYLHIGLGKTGTSTLQRALSEQQTPLAELGIEVPGSGHGSTRRAVYDLMGRRIGGADATDNARVAGAWKPFAAAIADSSAPAVVISEEMLALARPRTVRRLVHSLAPRRVVVVVTVRDLGRTLGSYWQQQLMMGRTETLTEFLDAVRDPASGPASTGVGFWMRQDLPRVLDAWRSVVPSEDFRIVTVPAAGQPVEQLNDRFAAVIGAPPGLLRGSRAQGNASVGVTEAEVVRRLNVLLDDSLAENQRLQLMQVVRLALVERHGAPIRVPADPDGWIAARAEEMVAALRDKGYPVVGALEDLVPQPGPEDVAPMDERELADAALTALAAVSRDQARLWKRARRRPGRPDENASVGDVATRARAASFRLRSRALARADRNRLLGWAARTYLRRTSGR